MSKYTPLKNYLSGMPAGTHEKTMLFEQIERIINDKLLRSAILYRAWWSNEKGGTHFHARSWMDAGWIVDTVSFSGKWVRFRRPNIDQGGPEKGEISRLLRSKNELQLINVLMC